LRLLAGNARGRTLLVRVYGGILGWR
jgi:hypothetical protein